MEETPLRIALTRLPMLMGIPVPYFAVAMSVAGFGFLFLSWKLAFAISAPLYGMMWAVAQYEPNFAKLIWVALVRTPKTKNKAAHKGNLYRA